MSRNSNAEVVWAVLAPLPHAQLSERAARAWQKRYGEMEGAEPSWEVLPGRAGYSAVIDRTRGSEGDDESLAQELSRESDGTFYLLRLRDEGEAVWAYERGELTRDMAREPYSFAESMGCALPEPYAGPPESKAVTLCVVEGATAEEVARALGANAARCRINTTQAGVLVYSQEISVSFFAFDIAEAQPAATVYSITSNPSPARFGVQVFKGEQVVGNYEYPYIKTSYPVLTDIKGETSPERIAAALGVPSALLGLGP